MRKHIFLILLLMAGLISLYSKPLSLDELIKAGLDNAYSLKEKEILVTNSRLGVKSAAWDFLPSADVSACRENEDGEYSSSGKLEIAKDIELEDSDYFNYQQAQLDKSIADLNWQQTRKEIVFQIYSAWLDWSKTTQEEKILREYEEKLVTIKRDFEKAQSPLLDDKKDLEAQSAAKMDSLEASDKEAGTSGKKLDIVRNRYKMIQGRLANVNDSISFVSTKLNTIFYNLLQNDVSKTKVDLEKAERVNALKKQRAELFNLIGLTDKGEDIEIASTLLDPSFTFKQSSKESLFITKSNTDLRKAQLELLQKKIGLYPTLKLSGNYGQSSENNDIFKFADYDKSYTFSMGLSWSLWSPWTKASNYSQLRNEVFLKELELSENQRVLSLDLQKLQDEWDYLKETLKLYTNIEDKARTSILHVKESFRYSDLSTVEFAGIKDNAEDEKDAKLEINRIRFEMQKKVQEWNLLNSLPVLDKY